MEEIGVAGVSGWFSKYQFGNKGAPQTGASATLETLLAISTFCQIREHRRVKGIREYMKEYW